MRKNGCLSLIFIGAVMYVIIGFINGWFSSEKTEVSSANVSYSSESHDNSNSSKEDEDLSKADPTIFNLIKANNASGVKALIDQDPHALNCVDGKYRNPLTLAALLGNEAICKIILDRGIPADYRYNANGCVTYSEHGYTPLFAAVLSGNSKVVSLLIQKGANVNARSACHKQVRRYSDEELHHSEMPIFRDSPSVWAASIVKWPPNPVWCIENEETTPLMWASAIGNAEIVRLLLGKGADINARSESFTALGCAVEGRRTDVVGVLLNNGANIEIGSFESASSSNPTSPLLMAIKGLIDPVPQGICDESYEIIELLIKRGARIDVFDDKGQTPRMLSTKYRDDRLIQILSTYSK